MASDLSGASAGGLSSSGSNGGALKPIIWIGLKSGACSIKVLGFEWLCGFET